MELKDRMKIPRHKMPEQPPAARARNFNEVPLGYSEETAIEEAVKTADLSRSNSCIMAGKGGRLSLHR